MRTSTSPVDAGDLVFVEGHRVGEGRRAGEILEVIGDGADEHYRVRWEDGRETIFYPGTDATFKHVTKAAR